MPYFKWAGVDLAGKMRGGKRFAKSETELDALLFKRDVALIRCFPARSWWVRSISLSLKIQFFQQLATLLRSGVLLPEALSILSDQIGHIRFQEIIQNIAADVREGVAIGAACRKYPELFNYLMVQMIEVGNDAGSLPDALDQLADHLEMMQDFKKKLQSAAMMPGLTLAFFGMISLFLFVFIVPRFVAIFASAKQELPQLTKAILGVSQFVRSRFALLAAAFCAGGFIVIKRFFRSEKGAWLRDSIMIRVPLMKSMIEDASMVAFLRSMAMLLRSGMQMLPALCIAKNAITNQVLRAHVAQLEQDVEAGSSLSQAMMHHDERLFSQELIAVVKVGEESGNLGTMLVQAAKVYHERVQRSITFFTTIFQPMLIVILGLLIALLVFAVYLPVFNLANAV